MARVNQPLISQSARELRAKEKLLLSCFLVIHGEKEDRMGSCSSDRFMIEAAIVSEFIFLTPEGIMGPLVSLSYVGDFIRTIY